MELKVEERLRGLDLATDRRTLGDSLDPDTVGRRNRGVFPTVLPGRGDGIFGKVRSEDSPSLL